MLKDSDVAKQGMIVCNSVKKKHKMKDALSSAAHVIRSDKRTDTNEYF